ncbi:MAG TPA: metalloregulator ArsR/SmtB family transcription factor [Caulobacter sp.]|nr:metalloregulator ArsR/SmtB family transcription factor [Caulobacter sp.]
MVDLSIAVEHVEDNAQVAADLLRLLANPHRLQVLCALRGGEASVGQMADHIGLSQSALSQHLAKMRADRIVATRREGQTIFYRIADPDVLIIVGALADVMERRKAAGGPR